MELYLTDYTLGERFRDIRGFMLTSSPFMEATNRYCPKGVIEDRDVYVHHIKL